MLTRVPATWRRAGPQGQIDVTGTRLRGRRLIVARTIWLVVIGLALLVFAGGVPAGFHSALPITGATRAALAEAGLSPRFPAFFFITTDIATISAFSLIAVLLFWCRSDDWMAMFVGLLLVLTALLYTHPAANAPVPVWLNGSLFGLGELCQVAFFYLFPNGRFVPRWTAYVVLPLFVWRPAMWALVYLPNYRLLPHSAETYGFIPQNSTDILLVVGLLVLGLGAQVYRYRRVSTPRQRQQAKWLLFGAAVTVAVVSTYVFIFNVLQLPRLFGESSFFLLAASRSIRQLALLVVPVAITISVLRYQLFDIDILINRALVYTALTATLLLVYLGSVIVLQQGFRALTGASSLLAVVASTLAITTLFNPLRRRFQALIDRRFYRGKYDAARTLQAFSATMRDEVDLSKLTDDLLAVVAETMQPTQISLWLPDDSLTKSNGKPGG